MRRLLALVVLLAATPALAHAQPQPDTPSPLRLTVDADPPAPMPAGATQRIELEIERRVADRAAAPGPGEADLVLEAPERAGCGPARQSVTLDPVTGRGRAVVTCQPQRPGTFALAAEAHAEGARPGTWTGSLDVRPDELAGELELGERQGYRFPANLTLTPAHLDQAPVEVTLRGDLVGEPLAFERTLDDAGADGSAHRFDLVARHGPGDYTVTVNASGPLTEAWSTTRMLEVPQPPEPGSIELNATVEAGDPNVSLTSASVNDPVAKYPGDPVITELAVEDADTVDVTVLRADGEDRVELARETVNVTDDGPTRHTFEHEPLPEGKLWVRAEAGDSAVLRNATIRDQRASAELTGPQRVLGDGRAWRGQLTLQDPNFGSTASDPGPVFGLPDLAWTVYEGHTSGSSVPGDFEVELGPFAGASEGTANASLVPWPAGTPTVDVEPGRARLPVAIRPPSDVEPGEHRLSLYADGRLLASAPFTLDPAPNVAIEPGTPRPGEPLTVDVAIEDPVANTTVSVNATVDGTTVANATIEQTGNASLALPEPIPAGTNVTVEARADWPGRPPVDEPDALANLTVSDLPPNVTVHPMIDGVATPAPVAAHPAASHVVELPATAIDPNQGPVEIAAASVQGPEGPVDWPVDTAAEPVRVEIPEDAGVGRYVVELATADGDGQARVPVDVAASVRVAVEGPDQVRVPEGGTRTIELTVANRGSVPLSALRLVADTELDVTARAVNETGPVPAGQPVGLALEPGERATLPVEVRAHDQTGRGSMALTVAGVAR